MQRFAVGRVLQTVLNASLIASVFAAAPVCAQTWPAKPIRLVVPLAPGGPSDLLARTMAQQLTPAKRQKRRERAMAAQHEVAVQVAAC